MERSFFDGYQRCPGFEPMFEWITAAWFEGLRPVSVPTVLLWGEEEAVLDVSQAAAFASVVPRSRVERVAGRGHFPMLEQPSAYASRVAAMARELARCAPAATRASVDGAVP